MRCRVEVRKKISNRLNLKVLCSGSEMWTDFFLLQSAKTDLTSSQLRIIRIQITFYSIFKYEF